MARASFSRTVPAMARIAGESPAASMLCTGSTAETTVLRSSSSYTAMLQGMKRPISRSASSAWWANGGLHAPRIL